PVNTGTGSLVDKKHRLVLTNVHVVGNPKSVMLFFPEYDKGDLVVRRDSYRKKVGISGRVVMQEERCDLSLVQLDRLPDGVQAVPFARKPVKPAQPVHSLGNPAVSRALWIYSPGRVRQIYSDKWQIYDDLEDRVINYEGVKIETDSAINPGDSGGPLVNDRAALVGVAHSIRLDAQNLSSFIDLSECKLLIEKYFKSIGQTWVPEAEPAGEETIAVLPDLIRKLSHKDFAVRLQATQALREMGPDASLAFGTLFQMLKDSE